MTLYLRDFQEEIYCKLHLFNELPFRFNLDFFLLYFMMLRAERIRKKMRMIPTATMSWFVLNQPKVVSLMLLRHKAADTVARNYSWVASTVMADVR